MTRLISCLLLLFLFSINLFAAELYPTLSMDPQYDLEKHDPNHHYGPKLIEALKEYTQQTGQEMSSQFYEWLKTNKPDLPKVKYFNAVELETLRQKIIPPNFLVPVHNGEKHTEGLQMFVMTPDGEFYCHKKLHSNDHGLGIHHSSFSHGKPVASVGYMYFNDKGELEFLSNGSGHYKPSSTGTFYALHELQTKGIDLSLIQYDHRSSTYRNIQEVHDNAQLWYQQSKDKLDDPLKLSKIKPANPDEIVKSE